MGPGSEGISLTSIASGMNDLSVLTNLDERDLSNIDVFTQGTVSAIVGLNDAINNLPAPIVNVVADRTTTTTIVAAPIVETKADRLNNSIK
ncbi:MAG: hypothetical protein Q9M43_10720 [Sulfurimonas sp.]|nr:hypothetical protein [Sulfurimonas sp.]